MWLSTTFSANDHFRKALLAGLNMLGLVAGLLFLSSVVLWFYFLSDLLPQ